MRLLSNRRRGDPTHWTATALSLPGWLRAGFAFLLLGIAALIASDMVEQQTWWVHGAWCISGLLMAAPVLGVALSAGFALVLRDHLVMFISAFALYFLFGSSLLALGPEQDIVATLSAYPVDAQMALRVDAVNAIGFGIALMTAALSPRGWFQRQADRVARAASRVSALKVMVVLMALGAGALLNTLSVDLGLREGVVSGTWRTVANFSLVAIYLGSSYRGRHQRALLAVAALIVGTQAFGGLLQFNKTAMLLPLAALTAGLAVRYGASKVLPGGLVLLAGLFFTSAGVVSFGRNTLGANSGTSIADRWAVLREGFSASRSNDDAAAYSAWARLCYVPSEGAALDFYDTGMGGDDLRLIPWLFVPRVLAPDKPIITQTSAEFHTKISGNEGSSTGQGVFASGYYNAGWPGVLLASVLCGWLLAQTSAIANAIFLRQALLLLPFALLGVYMAFRIDGHFVGDYLGAFISILYPLLAGSFVLAVRNMRR